MSNPIPREYSIIVYKRVIEYLRKIRLFMMSRQRAAHIQRMEEDSVELFPELRESDSERLLVAVCAHDLFRDVEPRKLMKISKIWNLKITKVETFAPVLLHGKVASEYLKRRFKLNDEEILDAVAYHTSGMPTDSLIVKLLVVLDTLEHGRSFDGVDELRTVAKRSVNEGYTEVIKNKIKYALNHALLILPQTVEAWNFLRGVR